MSVTNTVRDGHFDEIIVSTLPKKTSKWLRRDLVRKIEGLGLPVTTITPRATGNELPTRMRSKLRRFPSRASRDPPIRSGPSDGPSAPGVC